MDRFTHSSAPVKKVQAVQFGILDPDFIVSGTCTFSTGDCCLCFVERNVSNKLRSPYRGGTLL